MEGDVTPLAGMYFSLVGYISESLVWSYIQSLIKSIVVLIIGEKNQYSISAQINLR